MPRPGKTFRRLWVLILSLPLVPCTLFAEKPSIDSTKMDPSTIFARKSMKVVFSAHVADRPSHVPSKVRLLRLQAAGNEREVSVMRDDGTQGDLVKNDGTYACTFTMKEPIAGLLSFTVEAAYSDSPEPVRSRPFFVNVMGRIGSTR